MNQRNKYRLIAFIIITIVCAFVIILNLFSHKQISEAYSEQLYNVAINQKKDFLKDTVNNVIVEIDNLRAEEKSKCEEYTQSRLKRLNREMHLSVNDFSDLFIRSFSDDSALKLWTVLFWNERTNQILYSSPDLKTDNSLSQDSIELQANAIKANLASSAEIKKGDLRGVFGISYNYVDNLVKSKVADSIRSFKFSNDSYIWVNEIINYDGGDNYAIRRVNPNISENEGAYLSTNTKDLNGSFPYLKELEGVKKDGEIFFTFNFKKLNSDQISEKIAYSKLYKDYNWTVAMGVHLDDIDAYLAEAQKSFASLVRIRIISTIIYILLVLLAGFIILSYIEKKSIMFTTSHLEEKVNLDGLTKAASRRYGENILKNLFKQYKTTGYNTALVAFDIDYFKHINDEFGHIVGDEILINLVAKIKSLTRSSDYLIRMGGDEFLEILPGMKKDHVVSFCQEILDEIEEMETPTEKGAVKITISMGIAYFEKTDNDWNDALKRADEALYKSKNNGRNQVTF